MKWKWLILLALALVSCSREQDFQDSSELPSVEGQYVTVEFSITGPSVTSPTKVLDNGGDIDELWVAVFGSSGYLKEYRKADMDPKKRTWKTVEVEKTIAVPGGGTTTIKVSHTVPVYHFTVDLPISESPRKLHFIGNGPSSLPFGNDSVIMPLQLSKLNDENVGEKAYWQMITLDSGIRAKRKDGNYVDKNDIPYGQEGFSGFVLDPDLKDVFNEIPLIRNWAKIVLYAAPDSHFTPKSLAIVNFPTQGAIAPYSAKTSFVQEYEKLGFTDLKAMGYPANLPAGTVFDSSIPDAELFMAESFVDGGRVAGATTKEAIDADDEDSGCAVYMYERPAPTDNKPPTFVIIYGHYRYPPDPANNDPGDLENEDDYFYKVDLMETAKTENGDYESSYYPIYRNFKYQIEVSKILSKGQKTPKDAAASAGSADVSADITTGSLSEISDGVGRLHLTWMAQTYIDENGPEDPVEDLKVYFTKSPDGTPDLEGNDVTVKLLPCSDGGSDIIYKVPGETSFLGEVISTNPQEDEYGWRPIRFCTVKPGKTIRSQTMRITGIHGMGTGRLYRDVTINVLPIQPMWVECGSKKIDAVKNTSQSVTIGIPEGLTKAMFPLEFQIEAQDLTLYPDSSKEDNNLPVVSGKSISQDEGYAGKSSFQYVRTLTWEDYRKATLYQTSDERNWRAFTCYFKTNCAQNATKVWVYNKYFDPDSAWDEFSNYDFGHISDYYIKEEVPQSADVTLTFHFKVQPIDESGEFPELTLTLHGMINNNNPGLIRTGDDVYTFVPTQSDNDLSFITTNTDGDIYMLITAHGYDDVTIKPYRFNFGRPKKSYGLLEAHQSPNGNEWYYSNVAFGRVQVKKQDGKSTGNRNVVFGYFDDPAKLNAPITLSDPSGNFITSNKNGNNSGLIARSPSTYPWKPSGPYSSLGEPTYHEVNLYANDGGGMLGKEINFQLSSPGYVTESFRYERLTSWAGIHTLNMKGELNTWHTIEGDKIVIIPPEASAKTDNSSVKIEIECLDDSPVPVLNSSGIILGQDTEAGTDPGGKYQFTFTAGDIGINGMSNLFKNQRFFAAEFEYSSSHSLPTVSDYSGTYFQYGGSDAVYNWVAYDSNEEYQILLPSNPPQPPVSRSIIFKVESGKPVYITRIMTKSLSTIQE